jgi:hypothetical protein
LALHTIGISATLNCCSIVFFVGRCGDGRTNRCAIEMGGNCSSKSGKLLAGLCWVQAGVATAAAVGTFVQVETIVGFCPAIAFLGLVLAFVSLQRTSLNLLLFGLSCPVVTSTIALLIASLHWSPTQATLPVRVLLTLNAGITAVWGALTSRHIIRSWSLNTSAARSGFRFSVLSLLGVVTFACLVFALLRHLHGLSEWAWFAVYGVGVLVLSVAVSVWFSYRVICGVRDENDKQRTCSPQTIQNKP